MGTEYRIIDVDSRNKGLLVVDSKGRANIVVMVEKLQGAGQTDTMALMEEIKIAYVQYLQRVKGGKVSW